MCSLSRLNKLILHVAVVLAALLGLTPSSFAAAAEANSGGERQRACEALARQDFTNVDRAPTAIMESRHVAAAGSNGSYCSVKGIIAPQIQFELRLPDEWNGRYLQGGCGGFCGSIPIEGCADGQARGFAVAASNLGHVGAVWSPPVWATDPMLREDFGGRATHVLALAAKAIVTRYYGTAPRFSYFKGCSTGGREGLGVAQNHPEDFDGVIAGDPAFAGRLGALWNNWAANKLMTDAGQPVFAKEDLALLHAEVMKTCDVVDGVKDGVLTDARLCHYNPAKLQCRAAKSKTCLSAAQVAAARALYDGPRNSAGQRLHPGAAPYGSELDWDGPLMAAVAQQALRFLSFPQARPTFNYRDFDWDRDVQSTELAAAIYDPVAPRNKPELAAFRARGGRLIAYHGGSDFGVPPEGLIDYYAQVWSREGGLDSTREWFRVFIVPGMLHCRGGDAPDTFDMLTAIVNWVEQGQAPDGVIATQLDHAGKVTRSRPLFAYPNVAEYLRKGDPNDAANWKLKAVAVGDDRLDWIWKPAPQGRDEEN